MASKGNGGSNSDWSPQDDYPIYLNSEATRPVVNIPQKIQDNLTQLFKEEEALDDIALDISDSKEEDGTNGVFTGRFGSEYDYGWVDEHKLSQLRTENDRKKRKIFDEIEKITGLNVYDYDDINYNLDFPDGTGVMGGRTGATVYYTNTPRVEEYLNNPSYEKQYAIIPDEIYDESVGKNRVEHVVGVDFTPKEVFVKKEP